MKILKLIFTNIDYVTMGIEFPLGSTEELDGARWAIKGIRSHGVEVEKQMSYAQTRKSFVSILDRLTLEKAR